MNICDIIIISSNLFDNLGDSLHPLQPHFPTPLTLTSYHQPQPTPTTPYLFIPSYPNKPSPPLSFNHIFPHCLQLHSIINIITLMQKQQLANIWTLSPLCRVMQENKTNRDLFVSAFDRKQMLLRLISQDKIDAKKYLRLIEAATKDELSLVNECAYKDLTTLKSRKEKIVIEGWFSEKIEDAKIGQKDEYEKYQEYLEVKQRRQLKVIWVQDVQKTQLRLCKAKIYAKKERERQKINFDVAQLVSFKAIDSMLEYYQQNYAAYNQLFNRKHKMITLFQTKTLNHHSYKAYLQQYIAQGRINHPLILSSTKNDYHDLELFYAGNTQLWFHHAYEDTNFEFAFQKQHRMRLQQPTSQKLKLSQKIGPVRQSPPIPESKSQVVVRMRESQPQEQFNEAFFKELSNLMAIDRLLQMKKQNPQTYKSLFQRKRQICNELKEGKIDAQKYHHLQNELLVRWKCQLFKESLSEFVRETVQKDLSRLKDSSRDNVNTWLKTVISEAEQSFPQQQRIYHDLLARGNPSNLHSADRKQKIQIFLKAMAVYESLLIYFKRNQIPYTNHQYLTKYEQNKEQVYECIDKHEKDANYEILNLVHQFFPKLTLSIFYDGQLPKYKAEIHRIITQLDTQKQILMDFIQRIKRISNTQNIERAQFEIEKCETNIKYLREWPQGFVPFPSVTIQKVIKRNTDLNNIQANEVEIQIYNIQGIEQQLDLKVSLFQQGQGGHSFKVTSGPAKIKFIVKLNETQMNTAINGTSNYLNFKLYKKGFFGGPFKLQETSLSTTFKDFNTLLVRAALGQATIDCIVKVQKPKFPIEVELEHLQMKIYPEYKHSAYIEEELIKKMLPYCKPSESEILA